MTWPRAALLSLSDKHGAIPFAKALVAGGTRLLASGGTARHLETNGVAVTPIEDWTGFPEMLGGRVKTLHPLIHGPILARRAVPEDLETLRGHDVEPIDLVAVSLYPFEAKARQLAEAHAIEEIDIGGVALLRGAAKNFTDVIVVHDPAQYAEVLDALQHDRADLQRRRGWAIAAFARTARYDAAIAAELERRAALAAAGEGVTGAPPELHVLALERVRSLRYGENPHQSAALYAHAGHGAALRAWKEGKELSYNNLLDLDAAVTLAARFDAPACVIVKHHEPCGVATASALGEAYVNALRTDALSAYGGIVAFNRPLDEETAHLVAKQFVECVAAPEFADGAEAAFEKKKSVRLVQLDGAALRAPDTWDVRAVGPWALLQGDDGRPAPAWKVVTQRAPSAEEMMGLRFAWEVAAAARSNAIAIARDTALVGLGSGQTSRIDAVDVALMKARRADHDLAGTVLASDGFFPFADNIERAAEAGVTAFVQPGGSVRDAEVVEACERRGLAMVFTDRRTFRH